MLPELPVNEALPTLLGTLAAGRNAVLVAPPGAGKTTLVPLALLEEPWRGDGRILMLEPRRLATRAAATRMAFLRNEAVGGVVGFRTRLDAATSASTRIEVITEGLLVRRLQSDQVLDGVAAVILDEVHERSLETDLALALCLELQRVLRPELRLVAMSATADGARLAGLMDAEVAREHRTDVPRRDQSCRARHSWAARVARCDRAGGARGVGAARWRHPGVPARHGGDPPRAVGAGGMWRPGVAAAWRPATGGPGSRAPAG